MKIVKNYLQHFRFMIIYMQSQYLGDQIMKKYSNEMVTMIDNMIKMHYSYEEMYEFVKVCFPYEKISFNMLLKLVEQRVINML